MSGLLGWIIAGIALIAVILGVTIWRNSVVRIVKELFWNGLIALGLLFGINWFYYYMTITPLSPNTDTIGLVVLWIVITIIHTLFSPSPTAQGQLYR